MDLDTGLVNEEQTTNQQQPPPPPPPRNQQPQQGDGKRKTSDRTPVPLSAEAERVYKKIDVNNETAQQLTFQDCDDGNRDDIDL